MANYLEANRFNKVNKFLSKLSNEFVQSSIIAAVIAIGLLYFVDYSFDEKAALLHWVELSVLLTIYNSTIDYLAKGRYGWIIKKLNVFALYALLFLIMILIIAHFILPLFI